MKWIESDYKTFVKAKEYVDTVIIPLIPVEAGRNQADSVRMSEFTGFLTDYLERQFMGRLLLTPAFTYLPTEEKDALQKRAESFASHFKDASLPHVFFVTADMAWRHLIEPEVGELIWIPSFSVADMEAAKRQQAFEQQAKQIIPLFTEKWNDTK
ncbi:DUF2487 family protein [Paenalkalicoccus suaedae]|uniref:DUF2487 family protein n=1 Tax=Paenalkalicoccus suaedae TaxID=2592382 RepID=A0A859FFU3_9BACI|nr:DUF2487 family protein [Paenalkalicoccus suaedae]QKS71106.1 DUF2487 family protein [Paenalkalicoccus suaedae]